MNDTCPCCRQPLPDDDKEWFVDLDENVVIYRGKRCQLTETQAEYLYILARRYPGLVSREQLIAGVYGHTDDAPQHGVVSVHLHNIRKRLRKSHIPLDIVAHGPGRCGDGKYRLEIVP